MDRDYRPLIVDLADGVPPRAGRLKCLLFGRGGGLFPISAQCYDQTMATRTLWAIHAGKTGMPSRSS